jgi:hypothetical protein
MKFIMRIMIILIIFFILTIKSHSFIDSCRNENEKFLVKAAYKGDLLLIKQLIKKGVNINCVENSIMKEYEYLSISM